MESLRRLSSPTAAARTIASSEAASFAAEGITQGGLISGERLMWDAHEKRGMLELRHKEILARIDILNQMSTQAMLIAGAAVQGLGGESLQIVQEEGLGEVCGTLFVGTAAATLTSSLWVIFTSVHLVELSQQSALHGTNAIDVKEADAILEERMREVRER